VINFWPTPIELGQTSVAKIVLSEIEGPNMTVPFIVSSEKLARSLEKFGPMHTRLAGAINGRWCAKLLCRP
jgi:hypothetical protein